MKANILPKLSPERDIAKDNIRNAIPTSKLLIKSIVLYVVCMYVELGWDGILPGYIPNVGNLPDVYLFG